jgi:hypothetical protein
MLEGFLEIVFNERSRRRKCVEVQGDREALQGAQRLSLFGIHWLAYAIINQKALTIGESRSILCSTSHRLFDHPSRTCSSSWSPSPIAPVAPARTWQSNIQHFRHKSILSQWQILEIQGFGGKQNLVTLMLQGYLETWQKNLDFSFSDTASTRIDQHLFMLLRRTALPEYSFKWCRNTHLCVKACMERDFVYVLLVERRNTTLLSNEPGTIRSADNLSALMSLNIISSIGQHSSRFGGPRRKIV